MPKDDYETRTGLYAMRKIMKKKKKKYVLNFEKPSFVDKNCI